jgi:hypothetical protein
VRKKAEACSRRDGETVSGRAEERFAPEVVSARDINGTAWVSHTLKDNTSSMRRRRSLMESSTALIICLSVWIPFPFDFML